mgnify:CR=1 FL=1
MAPSSPAKFRMPIGACERPNLPKVRFFFSELFYPTLQFIAYFIEGPPVPFNAL